MRGCTFFLFSCITDISGTRPFGGLYSSSGYGMSQLLFSHTSNTWLYCLRISSDPGYSAIFFRRLIGAWFSAHFHVTIHTFFFWSSSVPLWWELHTEMVFCLWTPLHLKEWFQLCPVPWSHSSQPGGQKQVVSLEPLVCWSWQDFHFAAGEGWLISLQALVYLSIEHTVMLLPSTWTMTTDSAWLFLILEKILALMYLLIFSEQFHDIWTTVWQW